MKIDEKWFGCHSISFCCLCSNCNKQTKQRNKKQNWNQIRWSWCCQSMVNIPSANSVTYATMLNIEFLVCFLLLFLSPSSIFTSHRCESESERETDRIRLLAHTFERRNLRERESERDRKRDGNNRDKTNCFHCRFAILVTNLFTDECQKYNFFGLNFVRVILQTKQRVYFEWINRVIWLKNKLNNGPRNKWQGNRVCVRHRIRFCCAFFSFWFNSIRTFSIT